MLKSSWRKGLRNLNSESRKERKSILGRLGCYRGISTRKWIISKMVEVGSSMASAFLSRIATHEAGIIWRIRTLTDTNKKISMRRIRTLRTINRMISPIKTNSTKISIRKRNHRCKMITTKKIPTNKMTTTIKQTTHTPTTKIRVSMNPRATSNTLKIKVTNLKVTPKEGLSPTTRTHIIRARIINTMTNHLTTIVGSSRTILLIKMISRTTPQDKIHLKIIEEAAWHIRIECWTQMTTETKAQIIIIKTKNSKIIDIFIKDYIQLLIISGHSGIMRS